MIAYYNEQRNLYFKEVKNKKQNPAKDWVQYDAKKISWTDMFLKDLEKNIMYELDKSKFCHAHYRPFVKHCFLYEKQFLQRTYQQTKIFPKGNSENRVICIEGLGSSKDFGCLITSIIPDLGFAGIHTQCFPLYFYEETNSKQRGLFDGNDSEDFIQRDGVSNFILERGKKQYGKNVTKEDIFYYVYGFLHSKEYRETFSNDLKKMLPRLPFVEDVGIFWAFSRAGRKLADLHLKYETVSPYPEAKVAGDESKYYTVEKMRFPKKDQKDTIIYNSKISISNIPTKAFEYIVNGKSAIEWIMERYQITTHKESGIKNDPNDWAKEVGNPRYILDLLLSIINVSIQTVDIVNALPKIKFEEVVVE